MRQGCLRGDCLWRTILLLSITGSIAASLPSRTWRCIKGYILKVDARLVLFTALSKSFACAASRLLFIALSRVNPVPPHRSLTVERTFFLRSRHVMQPVRVRTMFVFFTRRGAGLYISALKVGIMKDWSSVYRVS
jgi:hypothetical protein